MIISVQCEIHTREVNKNPQGHHMTATSSLRKCKAKSSLDPNIYSANHSAACLDVKNLKMINPLKSFMAPPNGGEHQNDHWAKASPDIQFPRSVKNTPLRGFSKASSYDATFKIGIHTVDRRNPAPPDMFETLKIMGYLPYFNWLFGIQSINSR